MHPGAYVIAHGQGTGTLAKQQSLVLSFSLGSPATLRCHNKSAAHVTAANVSHRMQCPAAIGLQLRQVAVRAVVQPDIGSERDPLAGEQCLLVCGAQAFPCLQHSKVCFVAKWHFTMPWKSQAPTLCSSHSSVAPGSTARTSAVKQYTLMYCRGASPGTSMIQPKSRPDTSQPKTVSQCVWCCR